MPRPYALDLLTLKVVSESRVTWATSVPILVFYRLLCSRLRPDVRDRRQTDVRRQTDRRQTASSLNAPAYQGRGYNNKYLQIQYAAQFMHDFPRGHYARYIDNFQPFCLEVPVLCTRLSRVNINTINIFVNSRKTRHHDTNIDNKQLANMQNSCSNMHTSTQPQAYSQRNRINR